MSNVAKPSRVHSEWDSYSWQQNNLYLIWYLNLSLYSYFELTLCKILLDSSN